MQYASIENIYTQIMLLSDMDKARLFRRMQKELHTTQNVVAYSARTRFCLVRIMKQVLPAQNKGKSLKTR